MLQTIKGQTGQTRNAEILLLSLSFYVSISLLHKCICLNAMNEPFRRFSAPQRQCDRSVLVSKVGSAQVHSGARAADGEEVSRLAGMPSHRVHYRAGDGDLGQ